MDYTIETINNGEKQGRLNYYNVPLIEGEKYIQTIPQTLVLEDELGTLSLTSGDTVIFADEYLGGDSENAFITVKYETTEGGFILGDKEYPIGDCVEIQAIPEDDTYEFIGWFIDEECVFTEEVYRFTALQNTQIQAKFQKRLIVDDTYQIKLGENYEESYATMCINEDGSRNILIKLQPESTLSNVETFKLVGFDIDDLSVYNKTVEVTAKNTYDFQIDNLNMQEIYKMQLYDNEEKLIVSFVKDNGNLLQRNYWRESSLVNTYKPVEKIKELKGE